MATRHPDLESTARPSIEAVPDAPAPASGLELLGPMLGSGFRTPVCLVRRVDGQAIQMTSLSYALLESIDGSRTTGELAAVLSGRVGRQLEADDVEFLLEERLRPLGVLRAPDGSDPTVTRRNPLLSIRLRKAL